MPTNFKTPVDYVDGVKTNSSQNVRLKSQNFMELSKSPKPSSRSILQEKHSTTTTLTLEEITKTTSNESMASTTTITTTAKFVKTLQNSYESYLKERSMTNSNPKLNSKNLRELSEPLKLSSRRTLPKNQSTTTITTLTSDASSISSTTTATTLTWEGIPSSTTTTTDNIRNAIHLLEQRRKQILDAEQLEKVKFIQNILKNRLKESKIKKIYRALFVPEPPPLTLPYHIQSLTMPMKACRAWVGTPERIHPR